jgi:hypothetical protein
MHRVFLLSPANCGGKRAKLLFRPGANFELARRLHRGERIAIAEIFSFLSGLYFRGKFAYARRFGRSSGSLPSALVVTANSGLVALETGLDLQALAAFGDVPIDPGDPRYRAPLERDLRQLAAADCDVVLLGSISTNKYTDALLACLGDNRVFFPTDFVGRGDMSRGGLMLRCVQEGRELEYTRLAGAVRHGSRPPKLQPIRHSTNMMRQPGTLTHHTPSE